LHPLESAALPRRTPYEVDAFEDDEEILERAGQAIELPDNERVAAAELIEQPMQFGAVPPAAGCRLLEHLLTAGLLEGAELRRGFWTSDLETRA